MWQNCGTVLRKVRMTVRIMAVRLRNLPCVGVQSDRCNDRRGSELIINEFCDNPTLTARGCEPPTNLGARHPPRCGLGMSNIEYRISNNNIVHSMSYSPHAVPATIDMYDIHCRRAEEQHSSSKALPRDAFGPGSPLNAVKLER